MGMAILEEHSLVNPYNLMGLNKNSTSEDLNKSYKKLIQLCHPDKGQIKENIIINDAYLYIQNQFKNRENITINKNFLKNQEIIAPLPFYSLNVNEFNEKFKNILKKRENDEYDFILKNSSKKYDYHLTDRPIKKIQEINRFNDKQIYNLPEAINTYYDNYYSLLNEDFECNTFINGNLTGYDY